jgi:ureidoglycolate hydrolase|nr:putative ureidoglycolate hydrolase [uncultured bacterium pG7]
MALGSVKIEAITPESFAPFGTVVDWTPALEKTGVPFHVLVRSEKPTGWRMAILKGSLRATQDMENHPHTEELFAPVQGAGILLVAPKGPFDESNVHAFFLDRPVSVAPGVWHGIFALSESASVLIAENLEVSSEYAKLSRPLGAVLA